MSFKNFNEIQNLIYDKNKRFHIKSINFEFCSACNLRCRWCGLDHKKKKELMSENILIKVLEELILNEQFNIERIDLFNSGEILLHPRLEKMLLIIADEIKRFNDKRPVVNLLTNAVLLTKEKSRAIINSNALDQIRFSLDGGNKKNYEWIRKRASWEYVKNNVLSFLKINKKRIKTGVICIIPPEKPLTTKWFDKDFKELFSKIDHIELRHPHNWNGSKDLKLKNYYFERSNGRMCKFLQKSLVILPNGDVVMCCADQNSRGVVGNIKFNSLHNIVLSAKRLKTIYLFKNGLKNKIDLCKFCSGYYE